VPNCGFGALAEHALSQAGKLCGFGALAEHALRQAGKLCGFGALAEHALSQAGKLCGFGALAEHALRQAGNLCGFGALAEHYLPNLYAGQHYFANPTQPETRRRTYCDDHRLILLPRRALNAAKKVFEK
jgi:hypothetical protein